MSKYRFLDATADYQAHVVLLISGLKVSGAMPPEGSKVMFIQQWFQNLNCDSLRLPQFFSPSLCTLDIEKPMFLAISHGEIFFGTDQ